MFTRLLLNIGYDDKHNENDSTKHLRQEAVKWACILGVLECRKAATIKLEKSLQHSLREKYVILQYFYVYILWNFDMLNKLF